MIFTVSIDRKTRRWAVFDEHFSCVKEFVPFADEVQAVAAGLAWVAERSPAKPRVVYPKISKITAST
jgi:hypothetical protein